MTVPAAKQMLYSKVWSDVQDEYGRGFLVSERGLQAALYARLKCGIRSADIVVEPTWETSGGKTCRPDLVIVEGDEITDVFELKFAPLYYPRWQHDIAKLHKYVEESGKYPVSLNEKTGHWARFLSVDRDCCLHFVAVGHLDAEAVLLDGEPISGVSHWRGPTGKSAGDWDIRFA